MPDISDHARKNRAHWNAQSDEYQAAHGTQLARAALAWGVWSLPESELNILGDVAGKDVLEFGCGGAQWSIALAKRGARCVGIDLSERQLEHARAAIEQHNVDVSLLHASAEDVPLSDASFDIVFCDHGAMTFADPALTVPQASRLLRPGGLFAFSHETPVHFICWDEERDRISSKLHSSYFDRRHSDDGSSVVFSLPYGDWIRLFRQNGFVVEDLIELRPPNDPETTYTDYVDVEWAKKWPAEQIWRLRKT